MLGVSTNQVYALDSDGSLIISVAGLANDTVDDYEDDSIDILHIDIANNGNVFEFAIKNYLPKVRGVMILEGGSTERDSVEWMIKYNKPRIKPILQKYSDSVRITVLEDYPSITLISK